MGVLYEEVFENGDLESEMEGVLEWVYEFESVRIIIIFMIIIMMEFFVYFFVLVLFGVGK